MTHPIPFFPWLRTRAEIAELHDRLIEANTKAIFLENEVDRLRRRTRRERRRDAVEVARAIAARAQLYSERFSTLSDKDRAAAIERAKVGRRG